MPNMFCSAIPALKNRSGNLAANMPMLKDNLLYYPFPQSAFPLYQKEKALYDAYRVPVMTP